jgi:hypothetical protein
VPSFAVSCEFAFELRNLFAQDECSVPIDALERRSDLVMKVGTLRFQVEVGDLHGADHLKKLPPLIREV